MKFKIEQYNTAWDCCWLQQLIYLPEEFSFFSETILSNIDFELVVNKISLAVSSNIVIGLSGYCGLDKSMLSEIIIPEYEKGLLKTCEPLEFGFAYGITTTEWPVHINPSTGWVCVGDANQRKKGIEFINNCVAVFDAESQIVSLWLKPHKLPEFVL